MFSEVTILIVEKNMWNCLNFFGYECDGSGLTSLSFNNLVVLKTISNAFLLLAIMLLIYHRRDVT